MPTPRKPIEQHELEDSRPRWKEDAPRFAGGKPKMPKDLTPEAVQEWKRLVRELNRRGTLTRVDSSGLELYCRQWARWRKAAALAEANPTTINTWTDKNGETHEKVVEHPASAMAMKLENSLRNYLKEFSATPASRERTKPTAQVKKQEISEEDKELLAAVRAQMAQPREEETVTDINDIDETVGGTL
jgi:P27 family predicted phage terminase small subunit